MNTGSPYTSTLHSHEKGMGRLVWQGARADNATAHGYSGNTDWEQAQDCLPSTSTAEKPQGYPVTWLYGEQYHVEKRNALGIARIGTSEAMCQRA